MIIALKTFDIINMTQNHPCSSFVHTVLLTIPFQNGEASRSIQWPSSCHKCEATPTSHDWSWISTTKWHASSARRHGHPSAPTRCTRCSSYASSDAYAPDAHEATASRETDNVYVIRDWCAVISLYCVIQSWFCRCIQFSNLCKGFNWFYTLVFVHVNMQANHLIGKHLNAELLLELACVFKKMIF